MTLRHLRIFKTVFQEMSITKASKKLHLAQPSVSLAIRELEEQFSICLFDRINRKIAVTEQGLKFFSYATQILDLVEEMEHDMTSLEHGSSIHIGSSITIGTYLLPTILSDFKKLHPEINLTVSIRNSQQIQQGLLNNEFDLGLVEDQVTHEQLQAIPFHSDRLCFTCNCNHPLASVKNLHIEDLCHYPFFLRESGSASRAITDHLFRNFKKHPEITFESVNNESLLQATLYNPGITVLSSYLIKEELKKGKLVILPIYPEEFKRSFYIAYHSKKYQSNITKSFIHFILPSSLIS